MEQPIAFQPVETRNHLRIPAIIFSILALCSFILGSILLSLIWFNVGVHVTGKDIGAISETRGFAFLFLWPATMLMTWIFSIVALLLGKRWVAASCSLPVALVILYVVWYIVALFLLNISGVLFSVCFFMFDVGAIWLAAWFIKSLPRGSV
jgi:hypothetical protein